MADQEQAPAVPDFDEVQRIVADAMAPIRVNEADIVISEDDPEFLALMDDEDRPISAAAFASRPAAAASAAVRDPSAQDSARFQRLYAQVAAYIDPLKVAAVQCKKAGDTQQALAFLRSMKSATELRDRLSAVQAQGNAAAMARELPTLTAFVTTLPHIPGVPIPSANASRPATAAAQKPRSDDDDLDSAMYGLSAGHDDGDDSTAAGGDDDDLLLQQQHLQQQRLRAAQAAKAKAAAAAAAMSPPPRPVSTAPAANAAGAKKTASPAAVAPVARDSRFDREVAEERVLQRLEVQIEELDNVAKAALRFGQREQAAVLVRRKVTTKKDLELAQALRERGEPFPQHRVERIEFDREIQLADIDDQVLMVSLNSLRWFPPLDSWSPYVVCKLVDAPDANELETRRVIETSKVESKIEIRTQAADLDRQGVAEFKLTNALRILKRSDNALMRKLRGSRLIFEIFHKRLLFAHPSLGTGELRLKEIAAKCEATVPVQIKDSKCKPICELSVTLRARTPLQSKEVQKVSVDVCSFVASAPTPVSAPAIAPVLEPSSSSASSSSTSSASSTTSSTSPSAVTSTAISAAAATSSPAKLPSSTSSSSSSSSSQALSSSSAVAVVASPSAVAPAAPAAADFPPLQGGVTEAEVGNPLSIDLLFGNDVMDREKEILQAEIASLESKQDEASVKQLADAQQKLAMLSIKLDLLVLAVQNETLSLSEYLETLTKRAEHAKYLALALKQRNRIDEAKAVMARMKVMQNEISSAQGLNQ